MFWKLPVQKINESLPHVENFTESDFNQLGADCVLGFTCGNRTFHNMKIKLFWEP